MAPSGPFTKILIINTMQRKIAILWDESFLWGLIAYLAFKSAHIPFELISTEDVLNGTLENFDILMVPGGWANQKGKKLGKTGKEEIREFIKCGGGFLGFCGGAGLALDVPDGLALLPVRRKKAERRLINFSGGVFLQPTQPYHHMWKGINPPYEFFVWWPSQFEIEDTTAVRILASYQSAGTDFRVSDLNVEDIECWGGKWERWESIYGITLNPKVLWGEPSIIEGSFGKGKVILSYVHLDTPMHMRSQLALKNTCEYLFDSCPEKIRDTKSSLSCYEMGEIVLLDAEIIESASRIRKAVNGFYEFGYRNLLWNWRNPWLLHWKRGLRGLEYTTLLVMSKELTSRILKGSKQKVTVRCNGWKKKFLRLEREIKSFFEQATNLLGKERFALDNSLGPLEKLSSNSSGINRLRSELFGQKMSFGGRYRKLIKLLDDLLFAILRCEDHG